MAKSGVVKGLVIGGLAWLGWRTFMVRQSLGLLEYSIPPRSIALRWSGLTPEIHFNLNVFNPNRASIPLQSVAGQVRYKNQVVGSFQSTQPISIKGQENTTVALRTRVQLLNVFQLFLQKRPGTIIDINGILRTNVSDLPLKYSYDLANVV